VSPGDDAFVGHKGDVIELGVDVLSRTVSNQTYSVGKRDLLCADFTSVHHEMLNLSLFDTFDWKVEKETYSVGKRDLLCADFTSVHHEMLNLSLFDTFDWKVEKEGHFYKGPSFWHIKMPHEFLQEILKKSVSWYIYYVNSPPVWIFRIIYHAEVVR
jgi:hypothetical protein